MSTESVAYHRPRQLEDALRLLAEEEGARALAGGTDLLLGKETPRSLVSLRAVEALRGIRGGNVGALTTVGELARDPGVARHWPVLAAAARRLGSEQIRNVATVGGNLCRAAPCADTAPPLLVLEARVEIAGPKGKRELPLEEFFRGPGVTCLEPGELLVALHLPDPRPGAVGVFLKQGRVRMDLSLVSVAVLLEAEGRRCTRVRIAAGSVAPVPMRLREVEEVLEGEEVTPALLAQAGLLASRTVMPITDVRATEDYRRHVTGVFVRRAVGTAMEGGPA